MKKASSSSRSSTFGGFSTAREVLNSVRTSVNASEASAAHKKRKMFGGFSTAKDVFESTERCAPAPAAGAGADSSSASDEKMALFPSQNTSTSNEPNENEIKVNLLVRGLCYHKENINSLKSISLHREPTNLFDTNAIAVHNANGLIIGHVAREMAAVLAPYLDDRSISLGNIVIKEQRNSILQINGTVAILNQDQKDLVKSTINAMNSDQNGITSTFDTVTAEVAEHLSFGIAAQDLQTAFDCTVDFSKTKTLHWKTDANGNPLMWPPSNEVMAKFGFGDADNKEWWGNIGLNPPVQWNVSGAFDILPAVSVSSHQKQMARDALDDAVHGVTNIWSDNTMEEIGALMHTTNFWSYRGADAFIKAYGGPYVLGQQEGKLKLIKPNPHIDLTEKICRGHNIVYTLVHSEFPAGPGFNTLIFGLNLRRSGFHYHQDAIGSLKAKNAPLLPRQPVVTTVFYEKPQQDEGKEMVLWKPLMNFKPKDDSLYMAARGIVTSHGMVHVQKAGLQSKALHGIFRTPNCYSGNDVDHEPEPRMGYRVAITARITYEDSEKRLEPYLNGDNYSVVIGPSGNKTLRP